MIIGNFFDDSNTTIVFYDSLPCLPYYYIDDVCVSTDSVNCDVETGITKIYLQNFINIYPNPSNDFVFIEPGNETIFNLEIYNTLGELVYNKKKLLGLTRIELNNQPYGLYLIKIVANDYFLTKKIIFTQFH